MAQEFLAEAHDAQAAGRRHVAYDLAHSAAELAGKSLLVRKLGSYPRRHDIGGLLAHHGLLGDLDPRHATRLLKHHTRGMYGYEEPVDEEELAQMLDLAGALVREA